ncbi:protein giant [Eupeodes corollae]|uniref:protein giant n=1 Tax=Eupeodes corollae TaxID=290404 RepID=UPI002491C3BE|nr:protein giant [Eupeodes corollae]
MMLHEKIIPGQFLLDMKNDCTNNLLHSGVQSASKMDVYNSYNYHHHYQQERFSSEAQVLDLSRRCDSVETRKTPSPYNSTSSFGTASPTTHCGSPQTSTAPPTTDLGNTKLVFSHSSPPPLPQGIASLYPLYYPHIKQEISSPPPSVPMVTASPLPVFPQHSTANIQKTSILSPALQTSPQLESKSVPSLPTDTGILFPSILNAATTGAVSVSKSTRPFNAYPRDPLLVAAHFAASDVLFDKTTMERYSTYRKRALDDLRDTNGGHRIVTNPKMRRTNHRNNGQNSECEREEKAMESSDNDSYNGNGSSAECNSSKNDNNNNDGSNCGGVKDEAYFERRRKNNAAAKKSRDRRRIKEDEIAIRAAYLERQNIELLCQIDALKKQLEAFTKV